MARYKYEPLRCHLAAVTGPSVVRMTFAEIADLVGGLPATAHSTRQWWANNSQSQAVAWRDAGWHVAKVDQDSGTVEFEPGAVGGSYRARKDNSLSARSPHSRERDRGRWEGDVQQQLVDHLLAHGWTVVSQADTATKAQGIDVVARLGERSAAFEVKGFPSTSYADPARSHEVKPTNPATQARHWFAGAILAALLTKDAHPEWLSAVVLPDVGTYTKLATRTGLLLMHAGVEIWFVADDGGVSAFREPLTERHTTTRSFKASAPLSSRG